eukprot:2186609-Rhodomonas_salina.2
MHVSATCLGTPLLFAWEHSPLPALACDAGPDFVPGGGRGRGKGELFERGDRRAAQGPSPRGQSALTWNVPRFARALRH